MKKFVKLIFVTFLITINLYSVYAETSQVVCLNKNDINFIYETQEVKILLKNTGNKTKRFYLGLEATRDKKTIRIVPDIFIKSKGIGKSIIELKPKEVKTLKWKIPFSVLYGGRYLSDFEVDLTSSKLKLFLWEKDPFEKENREYLCWFIIELKSNFSNRKKSFADDSKCVECMNKRDVFKLGNIVFFKIKNRCNKESFLNLAVMTKDKKNEWVLISSTNPIGESEWMNGCSLYKPNEVKLIFWDIKYRWLFDKSGLGKFDKAREIKDVKTQRFYLFYYYDNPYDKKKRKLIFQFKIR